MPCVTSWNMTQILKEMEVQKDKLTEKTDNESELLGKFSKNISEQKFPLVNI